MERPTWIVGVERMRRNGSDGRIDLNEIADRIVRIHRRERAVGLAEEQVRRRIVGVREGGRAVGRADQSILRVVRIRFVVRERGSGERLRFDQVAV